MDLKKSSTVNKGILNGFCILYLMVSIISCSNINTDESSEKKNHLFSHIKVGFPNDKTDLSKFSDSVFIKEDSVLGIQQAFQLLKQEYDSLDSFTNSDIKHSKSIEMNITQIYFGSYLHQYMAYVHNKYGLIFLSRTDWEKDEFQLISSPNVNSKELFSLLNYCTEYHRNRNVPPPGSVPR